VTAKLAKLDLVETLGLSVVVPVGDRVDDARLLYTAYSEVLRRAGHRFEMIFVIDGDRPAYAASLKMLADAGEPIQIVRFNREFGEAACLREGIRRATGKAVLFLPAYLQIDPESIPAIVEQLDRADVVSACRDRQDDRPANRLRGWGFRQLARLAGSRFDDPGCVVRAARRRVFDEVPIQDEQHRFLPLMAELHGFKVEQMLVPQAKTDRVRPHHRPDVYFHVALDLLAVSFLLRFVQKPFRFFGTAGALSVLTGVLLGIYLLIERQTAGVPIADRPMFVLVVLLLVLGVQIAAIGLIAEIVIFTRGDGRAHYHIDTIVEEPPRGG
jgi:glycosyltransferase involved in cell wall biosynthesis